MDSEHIYRLRLRVALKLLALMGIAAFIGLLLSGLFSRPGEYIALPLQVDLLTIDAGTALALSWNGRRVLVLRRDAQMLASLPEPSALYDPDSRFDRLPPGMDPNHRSFEPEWFVVYAESTDLGCPVDLVSVDSAQTWPGGFQDRCRQGRYDFAGRVFRAQPAARNLEIPKYRIEGQTLTLLP